MNWNVGSSCRRLRSDRRGSVAMLGALAFVSILGFGAIVVDVGYVFHEERVLQAAADAAALAGASQLASSGSSAALSAATTYSAASGDKNADANLSVTATPHTVNCTGYTGTTCTVTASSPNGITVTQTANASTYFARVLGINSVPISATSYALGSGGQAQNADVMIILDTTASMNTADASCAGATREDCAVAGLQTMLSGFTPPTQQVGLMVFPGLTTAAAAAQEYDCSSSTPASSSIAPYNASPVYQIVPLSSDYKTGSSLNTSSDLVIAARAGASGCTAGLTAIGGVSTFYADVMTAAQTYLTANGRAGANKWIIFISDGDANGGTAANPHQECQQAITAAATAKAAGTTVFTAGYGSPGSGSCSTDTSPTITACQTLLQMATVGTGTSSAPQFFYTDTGSACTGAYPKSSLNAIFTAAGEAITSGGSRLIPNS